MDKVSYDDYIKNTFKLSKKSIYVILDCDDGRCSIIDITMSKRKAKRIKNKYFNKVFKNFDYNPIIICEYKAYGYKMILYKRGLENGNNKNKNGKTRSPVRTKHGNIH